MNPEQFLHQRFGEYYARNQPPVPSGMERREWGFGDAVKKIAFRHYAFRTADELWHYLAREAPLYISYSAAYYKFPAARPMPKKERIGADLVFDLDANELGVKCTHPADWICDACLEKSKTETVRLIEDFLVPDFGLSKNEMQISFSGNRGYHVRVFSDTVQQLDSGARKEIVDYIAGNGIDFGKFFYVSKEYIPESPSAGTGARGPMPTDPAWFGRLARSVLETIEGPDADAKLAAAGITNATKRHEIVDHTPEIKRQIAAGRWDAVAGLHHLLTGVAKAKAVALGDRIDGGVTGDPAKLLRLPDSLHGSTGLLAKTVKKMDSFDPLAHTIAFGDNPVKVRIKNAPAIRLRDRVFGPFTDAELELPEAAAIFFVAKGVAQPC